jgi:cytochrome bd-type quinol oxidase subunit 2
MDTSIFIARLIGPVMLVVAAAILKDRDGFRDMAKQLLSSRPLIFIAGMVPLVAGLTIVLTHNVWVKDWPVLITIFGWFAIFVGTMRIMFSQVVSKKGSRLVKEPATLPTIAGVLGILGAIFVYFGYFA